MTPALLFFSSNTRNGELLAEALLPHGVAVHLAHTPGEAEQALLTNALRGGLVDLSEDVEEGLRLASVVASRNLPFLLLAAEQSERVELEAVRLHARGVLNKPVRAGHLVEVVFALLGLSG